MLEMGLLFCVVFQALQSSVKFVPVLPAWKTVKRMKKKWIVEGALTGVLKDLSTLKLLAASKQNSFQKAVALKLRVMLLS